MQNSRVVSTFSIFDQLVLSKKSMWHFVLAVYSHGVFVTLRGADQIGQLISLGIYAKHSVSEIFAIFVFGHLLQYFVLGDLQLHSFL